MVTCGSHGCERDAQEGRYFCSNHSARRVAGSNAPSFPTPSSPEPDESCGKEDGDPSPKSWIGELKIEPQDESEPQSNELSSESSSGFTINGTRTESMPEQPLEEGSGPLSEEERTPGRAGSTRSEIWNEPGGSGMNGTQGTELTTAEKKQPDESEETQLMESSESLSTLDQERSRSMSAIDTCVNHLLGYMKSIGNDCEKTAVLRDFRQINAVANLGKQVAQLAKTKLDAIKEARKIQ